MTKYIPERVPDKLEELVSFVRQELDRISAAFVEVEDIRLVELHVEPPKPRDGMVILADGVDFNPGSGAGFYGRSAGVWVLLG